MEDRILRIAGPDDAVVAAAMVVKVKVNVKVKHDGDRLRYRGRRRGRRHSRDLKEAILPPHCSRHCCLLLMPSRSRL